MAIIFCAILAMTILITLWVFRGIENTPQWAELPPKEAREFLRECRESGGTATIIAGGLNHKVHVRCNKDETADF